MATNMSFTDFQTIIPSDWLNNVNTVVHNVPSFPLPSTNVTNTVVGTGAVSRLLQAKLAERVSVYDFGAKGDATINSPGTGTDDTVAFQAAMNYANTNGKRLFIPSGCYRLTAALNIDNSAQSTFPDPRLDIEGEGPQNSILQWDNGAATAGLSIKGSINSIAATSMQTVRDLSIIKADGTMTGLYLQSHAHCTVDNVWILGWNTGFENIDVQESSFRNVNAQYNVIGMYADRSTFTLPNALSFENCTFGNNKQAGLDIQNCVTFVYKGGSIESNNDLGGGPYTPIWGCRLNLTNTSVNEGQATCLFQGVYFERNGSATVGKGLGDLVIINSAHDQVATVIGCNFNRGTTFGTNQIQFSTSGGFRNKLVLLGNSHDAPPLGGYPGPSATRPYVQSFSITDPVEIVDLGNYYQSLVEAPNWTGNGTGPQTAWVMSEAGMASAWVTFNGSTGVITNSFNVASVVRNAAGLYTINFNKALSTGNLAPQITLNSNGFGAYNALSSSAVGIQTQNASGTNTDFTNISVVIYGGTSNL